VSEHVLTAREFADRERVSLKTAQIWLAEGKVPGAYQHPGGRWRIPADYDLSDKSDAEEDHDS
jgi:predicted site-specific integrase-resolvase